MTGNKVYADLTLAINFFMDGIILWAAAKLTGLKFTYGRIVLAALSGAVYALGFLLYPSGAVYNLPCKIAFSIILILLAFYPLNLSDFKRVFVFFYLLNFIAAGAVTGLHSLTAGTRYGSLSAFWIMAGLAVILGLGWWGKTHLLGRVMGRLLNYMIEIRFNGSKYRGNAFLDTGNMLRDPLTNRPVLIAEYAWFKELLPLDLLDVFEKGLSETEIMTLAANSIWADRLRIIPFTSIGLRSGILLGFRSDEIILNLGGRDICHKNVVVAVYQYKLCRDGHYQLLVPAEIVQN